MASPSRLLLTTVFTFLAVLLLEPALVQPYHVSVYDLDWIVPSAMETQSMPLGNGDVTLNLWVEASSGDLLYYAQTSAAFDENGQALKLARGRFHIALADHVTGAAPILSDFHHRLHLHNISQSVSYNSGGVAVEIVIWVDRHAPVVHFSVSTSKTVQAVNSIEIWRAKPTLIDAWAPGYFCDNRTVYPDVLYQGKGFGGMPGQILWYHRNDGDLDDPYYESTLRRQSLDGLGLEAQNPLMNRTFGAVLLQRGTDGQAWTVVTVTNTSYGLSASTSTTAALRSFAFDLITLTEQTSAAADYVQRLHEAVDKINRIPLDEALRAHRVYWASFWNRSYAEFHIGQNQTAAFRLTQLSILHRATDAMNGLSGLPIHFNGQLFSIGSYQEGAQGPDNRRWGAAFWWQNIRHSYYPAMQAGDFDILHAMFRFYQALMTVQETRVRAYYNHSGVYWDETLTMYGIPPDGTFGYLCNSSVTVHNNPYIRYHWDGSLELCLFMVDYYRYTRDEQFGRESLIPVCSAVIEFFRLHYPQRDAENKTIIYPSQALETWQCRDASDPDNCVTNSVVIVGALNFTLSALLTLPSSLVAKANQVLWTEQLQHLPPLPTGPCASNATLTCILPATKWVHNPGNQENVELYNLWPYKLYGLGLREYQLAMNNYNTRMFPCNTGWCQDIMDAVLLGLKAETSKMVLDRVSFQPAEGWKFPTFVGPLQDETPAANHFSVLRTAVNALLLQEIPVDRFDHSSLMDREAFFLDPIWAEAKLAAREAAAPPLVALFVPYPRDGMWTSSCSPPAPQ